MKRFFLKSLFIVPVFRPRIAIWFKNNQTVLKEIKCHAAIRSLYSQKDGIHVLFFRKMGKIGYSCST